MEPEHLQPLGGRSFLAAGEWAPRSGSTLNANFGFLLLATPTISSRGGSRAEMGGSAVVARLRRLKISRVAQLDWSGRAASSAAASRLAATPRASAASRT